MKKYRKLRNILLLTHTLIALICIIIGIYDLIVDLPKDLFLPYLLINVSNGILVILEQIVFNYAETRKIR